MTRQAKAGGEVVTSSGDEAINIIKCRYSCQEDPTAAHSQETVGRPSRCAAKSKFQCAAFSSLPIARCVVLSDPKQEARAIVLVAVVPEIRSRSSSSQASCAVVPCRKGAVHFLVSSIATVRLAHYPVSGTTGDLADCRISLTTPFSFPQRPCCR